MYDTIVWKQTKIKEVVVCFYNLDLLHNYHIVIMWFKFHFPVAQIVLAV